MPRCLALLTCLALPTLAWPCPTCGARDEALAAAPEQDPAADPVVTSAVSAVLSLGADARGAGSSALERSDLRLGAAFRLTRGPGSLSVDVPWIWRTARWGSGELDHLDGPGDVELRGRWTVRRGEQALTASAGAALPTAPLLRAADGGPVDWRLQLGSGAVTPLFAAAYERRGERWAASATLTATWPVGGWLDARPGRSVRAGVAAEEQLGDRLTLRCALDLRWDEAWHVGSAADPDSGGLVGHVVPEVRWVLARRWRLSLLVRAPFAEWVRGEQRHGILYGLAITFDA